MRYSLVLFDLDGTVYAGDTVIPGAKKAIETLEKKGVRVCYMTNSSAKSRDEVVHRLANLGIRATKNQVYSSGYVTARYIKERIPDARVLCVSSGGLQKELNEQKVELVSKNPNVVTVGFDRYLTYDTLVAAHRAIEQGAAFIASNKDHKFPVEDGFLPGAGSIVAALEYSSEVHALCMGKPSLRYIRFILAHEKVDAKHCLIVGDNLHTDITLGTRHKIDTVLVLSGVSRQEEASKAKAKPTYVLKSISEVPRLLDR